MTVLQWTPDAPSLCFAIDGGGAHIVIAIHEMGGSHLSFADLVPYLDGDVRLIRYDQRGAGLSEKPRRDFSFADHVDDLERVIAAAQANPPFRLIGLAAGAAIAIGFAQRHPLDVAALALCAPALGVSADRRAYLADRSRAAMREGMCAVEAVTLSNSYPQRYRDRDPARFAAYRGAFLANDPESYARINMTFAGTDVGDAAAALSAPCLLLAGALDALRPPDDVRLLLDLIPGARFEVIDSGHIMPAQAPAVMWQTLARFFQLD